MQFENLVTQYQFEQVEETEDAINLYAFDSKVATKSEKKHVRNQFKEYAPNSDFEWVKKKANNKELDSKEVFIEISNSMLLDNIVNEKFNTKKFQDGIDFISRYCGMIVGLLNVGLSEEQAKEIIIEIIDEQL